MLTGARPTGTGPPVGGGGVGVGETAVRSLLRAPDTTSVLDFTVPSSDPKQSAR